MDYWHFGLHRICQAFHMKQSGGPTSSLRSHSRPGLAWLCDLRNERCYECTGCDRETLTRLTTDQHSNPQITTNRACSTRHRRESATHESQWWRKSTCADQYSDIGPLHVVPPQVTITTMTDGDHFTHSVHPNNSCSWSRIRSQREEWERTGWCSRKFIWIYIINS